MARKKLVTEPVAVVAPGYTAYWTKGFTLPGVFHVTTTLETVAVKGETIG